MIDDDISKAAQQFNEAIRLTARTPSDYTAWLKGSRDHLRAWWAMESVNSDALLAEMEDQLPAQLRAHPELRQAGLYWRYRAWFKYHIGVSAFRLGAEDAADSLLHSAESDAARAYGISEEHVHVYTYLPEAGWGWYHIERGRDYEQEEDLTAALADYGAAFDAIQPDQNARAQGEKAIAAFCAGLVALRLEQTDRAEAWYADGTATVKAYADNPEAKSALESAIVALQELLEKDPTLVPVAQPLLDEMEAMR
jgi:hypothetical protein